MIDKNETDASTSVLDSPDFLAVSQDVIQIVIERDAFPTFEVDLFKSIIKWSMASCQRQGLEITPENQRKVMDSFIHRIRFPLMDRVEFGDHIYFTGILSKDECSSILNYISSEVTDGLDFDSNPRDFQEQQLKEPTTVTVTVAKDISELKCMAIERPGTHMKYHYYCVSCDSHVCFVCAAQCHYDCENTKPKYDEDGSLCYCKLTHLYQSYEYTPIKD